MKHACPFKVGDRVVVMRYGIPTNQDKIQEVLKSFVRLSTGAKFSPKDGYSVPRANFPNTRIVHATPETDQFFRIENARRFLVRLGDKGTDEEVLRVIDLIQDNGLLRPERDKDDEPK